MKDVKDEFLHPLTTWTYIKKDLEVRIVKGEYKETERIPSVRQLTEMYSVSPSTIQKVVKSMSDEGIIIDKKGLGYYVNQFGKERLIQKHKNEVFSSIEKIIEFAKELQVPKQNIIEAVRKSIEKEYE